MESKPVLLIVEDEILVRTVAVEIAGDAGFAVLQADDAIRVLQSHPDIRVVLTDVDMPGSLDGLELAQAIRHRWAVNPGCPDIRKNKTSRGRAARAQPLRSQTV